MPATLAHLQELRSALGVLDAERPAGVRLGQTRYSTRDDDFGQRLDLEITSRRGKARILVTGQIGVGKSSELWHYFHGNRGPSGPGFMIFCDLEKEEHPEHCGATGVLLAIVRDCWGATRSLTTTMSAADASSLANIRDEMLTRLIDWLKGEYSTERDKVTFRFGGMDFPVFLQSGSKDAASALVLGKAAQHEAVSEPSERFGLAPDSLVNLLNRLLEWVGERTGRRAPILFVDHVDKIRNPVAAEEVLIKATPHWNRISASIVMTAPFEYTLGELRNSVESKWGRPLLLYPLPIPNRDSGSVPVIYTTIIRDARLGGLVPEKSLRLLAYYSGGVLRAFVQLLIQACKEAHFASHDVIEEVDAEAVVQAASRAYQDYSLEELELLDKIERHGTGLGQAANLLRSPIGLLVCRPLGAEQVIRIHPQAERAVDRFRLLRSKGSA